MNSLQQQLADTAAKLNAQYCELKELRERVRKAQLLSSKSPRSKQRNRRITIPLSHWRSIGPATRPAV
jgi:anti-sigma-K factor RskA